MKEWKHLTYEQRKVISSGIAHQKKAKHIAESLGVDPTAVSKEVKRNRDQITIGLNLHLVSNYHTEINHHLNHLIALYYTK